MPQANLLEYPKNPEPRGHLDVKEDPPESTPNRIQQIFNPKDIYFCDMKTTFSGASCGKTNFLEYPKSPEPRGHLDVKEDPPDSTPDT